MSAKACSKWCGCSAQGSNSVACANEYASVFVLIPIIDKPLYNLEDAMTECRQALPHAGQMVHTQFTTYQTRLIRQNIHHLTPGIDTHAMTPRAPTVLM